jgi:hypothetical protein
MSVFAASRTDLSSSTIEIIAIFFKRAAHVDKNNNESLERLRRTRPDLDTTGDQRNHTFV